MIRPLLLPALLAPLLAAAPPAALPRAKASSVGMSAERLERLRSLVQRFVAEERIGGAVVLVMRRGGVVLHEGFGERVKGAPMKPDALFRIASQTKAVTSVALMMLQEEGRLLLSEPLAKYLPEFKQPQVAVADGSPEGFHLVPARRAITLGDLLTHTSGYGYGRGLSKKAYEAAGIQGWLLADRKESLAEAVQRLAKLPLDAHPGEAMVYGYNTDILGRVIEVVSGQSLEDFMTERIFKPLGMRDTHFFVPEAKASRLTGVFAALPEGGLKQGETPEDSLYLHGPRQCFSGGAGLVSTAQDYGRFLEMLRRGGELGGVRLLGPKSVELMVVNHIGTKAQEAGQGQGFGLGFEITEDLGRDVIQGSPDAFAWAGAYHTSYWVDPREELVALCLTQTLPARGSDLLKRFKVLVYQAITDSRTWTERSGGRPSPRPQK